jgi:hypothetical protein
MIGKVFENCQIIRTMNLFTTYLFDTVVGTYESHLLGAYPFRNV